MIIEDFNPATDIKVEFFVPGEVGDIFIIGVSELGGTDVLGGVGIFTLGVSLLGGTDVLGADNNAFIWVAAEAETSNFQSSTGGYITNATYFQPQSASSRMTLQSYAWDPNVNRNIRAGVKVRLRVERGEVDHVIYIGVIDNISVSYYPDGPNLIQISSYDIWKNIVNTVIPTYDTSALPAGYITPLQAMTKAVNAAGYEMAYGSAEAYGKIPLQNSTDLIASEPINDALQVGLALSWVDPATENIVFIPRPTAENATETTWTLGNNHSDPYHLCLSDIEVEADRDSIVNSLQVTLASDESQTISLIDQDLIDLYGNSSQSVILNVLDATEMSLWADRVFANKASKLVKRVTTPTIDRLGNLTQAAVMTPGTLVGVKFTRDQLAIDDYYTVINVSHSLDVNVWYTTLELWKES